MSDFEHIAWLDLETTGTNPYQDQILEVGVVLTDRALNEVDTFEWVAHFDENTKWRFDDVVQRMHASNGLWRAANTSTVDIPWIDRIVAGWLVGTTKSTRPICLAGSGVSHFDSRFLAQRMPLTNECMTYYTLDVGVVRRFVGLGAPELVLPGTDSKKHRALADAIWHLEEARHYMGLLGSLTVEAVA